MRVIGGDPRRRGAGLDAIAKDGGLKRESDRGVVVLGARKGHNDALRRWASGMLERKTVKYKFKLTAVALANKLARIVYALATKGGHYDDRPAAA